MAEWSRPHPSPEKTDGAWPMLLKSRDFFYIVGSLTRRIPPDTRSSMIRRGTGDCSFDPRGYVFCKRQDEFLHGVPFQALKGTGDKAHYFHVGPRCIRWKHSVSGAERLLSWL